MDLDDLPSVTVPVQIPGLAPVWLGLIGQHFPGEKQPITVPIGVIVRTVGLTVVIPCLVPRFVCRVSKQNTSEEIGFLSC